jgi:hypothetical protein
LSAGPALATHCSNVEKQDGAGSAGTATVNVVTGEITPVDLDTNPAGNIKGGFITVTPALPDGTVVGEPADVFKKDLPDGAHNAGRATTSATESASTISRSAGSRARLGGGGRNAALVFPSFI